MSKSKLKTLKLNDVTGNSARRKRDLKKQKEEELILRKIAELLGGTKKVKKTKYKGA